MTDRAAPTRVGILDAAFLDCEGPATPMHVGGLLLFAGRPELRGRPGAAGLLDTVAERLPLLPRLRQRLQPVPFHLADPVWVDDAGFDIARHVRRRRLSRPGGEGQLWALVAELHARPLDRRRPLWELHLIEGLADGRVAAYVKLHHAMVDGLAAVQLGLVLLDADPEGGMRVEATPAATSAPPPGSALMADAIRDTFEATVGVVRSGLDALRRPAALARGMGAELGGARSLASLSRLAPRMPFSGIEVGARRRIAAVRLPLAAAKEVKDAFGTTVNDVVLATVAEAIHGFLAHRSDPGHGVTCRVLVPVSRRGEAEAAAMGNGLAGMFVDLPVGPLAPGVRLRTIARGVGDLKVRRQASATDRLMSLASLAPQPLRSLGLRVAVRQQRLVNMVVSNVPGVQMPLYAGGARLLEAYPLLPLAPNLGLTICVLSYAGTLHFGVVADIGAFPDLEILTDGLASGMARLTAAARARARLAG